MPARAAGDVGALRRAYQAGVTLGGGGGLASIPVFDAGPYNDAGGYHYQWFHFAVRERMKKQNGRADNHLMWRGVVPAERSWAVLERWVTAVKADRSSAAALRQGRAQQAGGRGRRLLAGGDRVGAGDVHRRAADLRQSAELRVQQDAIRRTRSSARSRAVRSTATC